MNSEYIAINDADPRVELPVAWCVCRVADGMPILMDVNNPDTQMYLAWLDAGNKPEIVACGGFPWDPGYGEEVVAPMDFEPPVAEPQEEAQ